MTLVNLTIDGKAIQVPKGTTVYEASKQLGIDIPIFCYQDRMPPFGACRMCLVEVEKMPKLQTSCTLEVAEGMVVKTQSQIAVEGRKSTIEFLLINHPLDCPICDRGGECPLQENALSSGCGESRFFEEKRHFTKAKPLGPVLMLDRERCIVCARCTRFGEHIAGDHALEFINRGFRTEVGTPDGGPAESKFIGNTIMICPVGALTSQVYRFRARPWDNTPTNSTCTLCPVGCSMILDSRDGEIMRTRSQENPAVNDIWLCDKGWFGYEFTYSPERLQHPLIKGKPASWDEALALVSEKLKQAKTKAGFGGQPLTTEENALFQDLIKDNLDYRMSPLSVDVEGGMETPLAECEKLQNIIILGLDLTEDFPVIWLRMRQAINKGAKVLYLGHYKTEIDRYFSQSVVHTPGEELEFIQKYVPDYIKEGCAIFVGSQYLANPLADAILAKLNTYNVPLNLMVGRGNFKGAALAGMRKGLSATEVLAQPQWDFLYVAGANPVKKYSNWKKPDFLVVNELFMTETAQQADVVLPTLTFIEKGGSFINIEGLVQTLMPGKEIPENLLSDSEIFQRLGAKLDPSFIKQIPFTRPQGKASSVKLGPGIKATFAHALFDNGVRIKNDPHVHELVLEPFVRIHPDLAQSKGIADGDTVKINTITAKVKLDRKVALNTLVIPLGFDAIEAYKLAPQLTCGMDVELWKL